MLHSLPFFVFRPKPSPRHQRVHFAFFALLFWLGASGLSWGQDYFVSPTGNDANAGTSIGSPKLTIQAAITAASAGNTIQVAAGTYNENVTVNKSLTIVSASGKGSTIVSGSEGFAGTFNITANNVTIGAFGKGFTINGYDGASPGIERAAVYLTGAVSGITIRDNNIVANGEAGLLTEFNQAVSNIIVDANTFSGKTFTGAEASGCGFGDQDTQPNRPRQLALVGQNNSGSTNVTFTSNVISGTAGTSSTASGCTAFGQGNTLVTIDANNSIIRGNTFAGTTTRFGTSLRARGTNVSVSCNTFNNTGLGAAAAHIFFDADPLTGGANPSSVSGVASLNTFPNGGAYLTTYSNSNSITIYRDLAQATAATPGAGTGPVSANAASLATVTNTNTGISYCTIQSAINDVNTVNGHTIQVGAGTYLETVTVSKSLTLLGANSGISGTAVRGAESIIDASGSGTPVTINANNVVLNGFTIQKGDPQGVAANGFTGTQILNNIITDNVIGVAEPSPNVVIRNNLFDGNNRPGASGGAAIYSDVNTNGLLIEGNEFKNHTANNPILLASNNTTHTSLTISQNYLHDNSCGGCSGVIYLQSVQGGTITRNRISEPTATRAIRLTGGNSNVSITNNLLNDNQEGVKIDDDNVATANTGISINENSFTGVTGFAINNEAGSPNVNATCNWYGTIGQLHEVLS